MSELDKAVEKLEKNRKCHGKYKGHLLTLRLKPVCCSMIGKKWEVTLNVGLIPSEDVERKSFWRYISALKYYVELKEKYGL